MCLATKQVRSFQQEKMWDEATVYAHLLHWKFFVTLLGLSDAVVSVTAAPFPWMACMYLFRALLGSQGNCIETFSAK